MISGWLQTVKGAVAVEDLGLILPHEHLFTDLRGPLAPDYALAEPEAVARVMEPYLAAAQAIGVTALVECSTVGVGRNIAVLQYLAEVTPIYVIAPTGAYREDFTPPSLRELSVEALAEEWVRDLTEGIEGTEVRAGFIKIAMSDDGPTPLEVRNLKAAALASRQTDAVVVSHTASGAVARREMEILESAGLDLGRFIWAHANLEPDPTVHLEAARRGAYVEFDAVGAEWQPQSALVDYTLALIEAGCAERILLSHDAGWYDPSQPDGQPEEGGIRGYTALVEEFIPALRARGVTDDLVHLITVTNPARAFAFADTP
ncbi:MAG: esterase [Anaerolineales bacterium]|nr:MAG: esterase [Anaerolineales bacterium]